MHKMLNIVRDIIVLNLNVKLTKLPQLEFIEIINIINGKSGHSQKSNPNIISEQNDQRQLGNLEVVALRRVHKLVSKITYFTWLHKCKRDSQSNVKNTEARKKS